MKNVSGKSEADLLKVDRNSYVPLHVQVEKILRELILLPEYAAGKFLPDENTLALKLGISRMTLRNGINRLMYEGALERKRGVGTKVAPPRIQQSGLRSWYSLNREMADKGIKVVNFKLEVNWCKIPPVPANALGVKAGVEVLRMERIRGWNGQRVTRMVSWLHPRLGLKGNEDFSVSLSETVERETGVRISRTVEEVAARPADAEVAARLEVEAGSPLLYRSQLILDAGDKPVFYNENHYRGDMFTLSLDVKRND